jgi:outer membrane immunogenic protein
MKPYGLSLLVFTLTSALALSANAADISTPGGGLKDGKYVPYWGGFYVGASIGAGGSETDVNGIDTGSAFKNTTYGVFGGAHAGYNFQRGNYVFGPEIDLGGLGLSHSANNGGDISSKIDSGFYFDATARLGYTMGQMLVYAKGGYAFYDGSVAVTDAGTTFKTSGLSGWTAGGGMEYSLNPAWSLKWEILYFDFDTQRLTNPVNSDRFDNHLTVHTAVGGVNYHIGSVYEPLK